ncbi:phase specific protein [Aspergillus sp. HF37]|nr:phase specific protein [Aspergillus sp. HF37]
MKSLSIFLTTLLTTSSTLAAPHPHHPPVCGSCNPVSGENNCDITTSCINTGQRFHCACRAGYKASADNEDFSKHFRLDMPDYQHLVFTTEHTECNKLCDNPHGASDELCAEVPLYEECVA